MSINYQLRIKLFFLLLILTYPFILISVYAQSNLSSSPPEDIETQIQNLLGNTVNNMVQDTVNKMMDATNNSNTQQFSENHLDLLNIKNSTSPQFGNVYNQSDALVGGNNIDLTNNSSLILNTLNIPLLP